MPNFPIFVKNGARQATTLQYKTLKLRTPRYHFATIKPRSCYATTKVILFLNFAYFFAVDFIHYRPAKEILQNRHKSQYRRSSRQCKLRLAVEETGCLRPDYRYGKFTDGKHLVIAHIRAEYAGSDDDTKQI